MAISAAEITTILKSQIKGFESSVQVETVGTVLQVGDGVARIHGLKDVMVSEMLEFPGGVFGIALNLEEDNVGAVLLGDDTKVKEGDTVRCTGRIISVPVGDALVGRVVNAIGQAIDGKGPISTDIQYPVERNAPSVVERQPVHEPLATGVKSVDAMFPIGRGQRELVIGDRSTGKTAFCVDAILNQKGKNVICIYVAIGQKLSTVKGVMQALEARGAMEYTIIVSAPASDPASMQWLAPFTGTSMGEFFRDNGRHALIVYDDLYKHAMAWRQVSLLLRRPPAREAFPGDVFNLHSRLLERSAKMSKDLGSGSLTALPVVEIQQGDVTAYIPTNVISITDGQIYLEADLFNSGFRPAVNVGLSVSRVGGAAQTKATKKVAGRLKLEMAQFRELAAFAQFGSDLDAGTLATITRGERLMELLKQPQYSPVEMEDQVMVLYAATNRYLDKITVASVRRWEKEFLAFMHDMHPNVPKTIRETGALDAEREAALKAGIEQFNTSFKSGA
ncbi:MAG TPA: F0F1 ATP synthase subunit alpha [Planctomycetota bacterium]|jgi:F-type H+-transporting ATPase subunit alpha|nr:F0F1 ATP synthase subunit alpha [Planctomycetota bacterium]